MLPVNFYACAHHHLTVFTVAMLWIVCLHFLRGIFYVIAAAAPVTIRNTAARA